MVRRLFRILCFVVIISCIFFIGYHYFSNKKDEKQYQELWNIVNNPKTENDNKKATKEKEPELDLKALQKMNQDCIGYINIEGTPIRYPIMKSDKDNGEYYLNHDFYKNSNANGTPFLDYRCDTKKPDSNLIVYGHNLRSTRMFSALKEYKDINFLKEHSIIQFEHENGGNYQIFAILEISIDNPENREIFNFIQPSTKKEHEEYLKFIKDNSIYDTGIEATTEDELVTLVTCYRLLSDGRLLIIGKKI